MNDWTSPWESNPPTPLEVENKPQHAAPSNRSAFPFLDTFVTEAPWGRDDTPVIVNQSSTYEAQENHPRTPGLELAGSEWPSYSTDKAFTASQVYSDLGVAAGVQAPEIQDNARTRDQDIEYGYLPSKSDPQEDTLLALTEESRGERLDRNDEEFRPSNMISDSHAALETNTPKKQEYPLGGDHDLIAGDLSWNDDRGNNASLSFGAEGHNARLDEDNWSNTFTQIESELDQSFANNSLVEQTEIQGGIQIPIQNLRQADNAGIGLIDRSTDGQGHEGWEAMEDRRHDRAGTARYRDHFVANVVTGSSSAGTIEGNGYIAQETVDHGIPGQELPTKGGRSLEGIEDAAPRAAKSLSPSSQSNANSPALDSVGTLKQATPHTHVDGAGLDRQLKQYTPSPIASADDGENAHSGIGVDDSEDFEYSADQSASQHEARHDSQQLGKLSEPAELILQAVSKRVGAVSEETAVSPEHDAQSSPPIHTSATFVVDKHLVVSLFPALSTLPDTTNPPPVSVPDHLIATTSARKTWYRLTRPGPSRQHASADLDAYIRVTWRGSAIQARVAHTVAGWVAADRATGGAVFNPSVIARAEKPFRWSEKEEGAGGSKLASEHRPLSALLAPPPPAGKLGFGWSSEAVPGSVQEVNDGIPAAVNGLGLLRPNSVHPVGGSTTPVFTGLALMPLKEVHAEPLVGDDGFGPPQSNSVRDSQLLAGPAPKTAPPFPDAVSGPSTAPAFQLGPSTKEADVFDDFGTFVSAASPAPVGQPTSSHGILGTEAWFEDVRSVHKAPSSLQDEQLGPIAAGTTRMSDFSGTLQALQVGLQKGSQEEAKQDLDTFLPNDPSIPEARSLSSHNVISTLPTKPPNSNTGDRASEHVKTDKQLSNPISAEKLVTPAPTAPLSFPLRQDSDLGDWFSNTEPLQHTPQPHLTPPPLYQPSPSIQLAPSSQTNDWFSAPPSLQPSDQALPIPRTNALAPQLRSETTWSTPDHHLSSPAPEDQTSPDDFDDFDNFDNFDKALESSFGQFISSPAPGDDGVQRQPRNEAQKPSIDNTSCSTPHKLVAPQLEAPSEDWGQFFAAQLPRAGDRSISTIEDAVVGGRPASGVIDGGAASAVAASAGLGTAADGNVADEVDHVVVRAVVAGLPNFLYML